MVLKKINGFALIDRVRVMVPSVTVLVGAKHKPGRMSGSHCHFVTVYERKLAQCHPHAV